MFDLLKMDIRHLFKSRSFYIVLGVTAALVFLVVLLAATMADSSFLDEMQSQGMEVSEYDRQMSEEIHHMTQLEFISECIGSGFLLIMAGVGVTLFVHGDFSSGFIKNICFARPRRWEYVLSKVLLSGVYSGAIVLLGVLLSMVFPLLFGLHPAGSPVVRILEYVFWNWLLCWAFSLMGLALVLLTRSSTLGIVLAVVSGGGVTMQLLQMLCQALHWPDLWQYLLSSVARFQCVPMPNMDQIAMILGCSIGWAAAPVAFIVIRN